MSFKLLCPLSCSNYSIFYLTFLCSDFWMQKDLIPIWNVSDIVDTKGPKPVNLTSNGLERYNRHINSILPSDHPNLVAFANALRAEADRVTKRMEDIDKGREKPPEYSDPVFPTIPQEFWDEINNIGIGKKKQKKAAGKKRKAP